MRERPKEVRKNRLSIPTQIVEPNKFVWLAGDMMFVDEIAFVMRQ